VKAGRLKVLDATCPAVYAGLQAGAKGQPFAPLRGLIGSDLLRHRADYRVIDNPWRSRRPPIAVVPAINTDVAIFHAARADAEGNVWVGRDRDRLLAAHAANTVLVTVDTVRARQLLRRRTHGRRRGARGPT
jgi:glutaconate CoA-transferase subunit A